MSNDQLDAVAGRGLRVHYEHGRRGMRVGVIAAALLVGIGGLASCGDDDDDASDTVPGLTADAAESSAPGPEPTTTDTSAAPSTSAPSTSAPSTSAAATAADTAAPGTVPLDTDATVTDSSAPVEDTQAATTTAAGGETTAAGTAETPGTAVDTSVPGSAPESSLPAGSSIPESSGPTTTGPECTFTDNEEFPLERCNAGPPIAALQSVLQVLEYDIGTVDCLFGDQTLYAVRAFQADQELPVTGTVDADTWAALEESFLPDFGDDTDGSGSVEPDEITLVCA